jgi:hypothetical protein
MMIFPARKIPRSEPHKISKKRRSVKDGEIKKPVPQGQALPII